jgi:predicted nucleotidyltransferase
MNSIKAIEGYFCETKESLIFDVKGVLHPYDRIISFLRYYPSSNGTRVRNGRKFSKVYKLRDRFEFLQKHYPYYLFQDEYSGQILQGVHYKDIKKIYNPTETVKRLLNKPKLSDQEKESISFVKILGERVTGNSIGLSGSLMVGLHTRKSDMDIVVYGMDASYKVHKCLTKLMDERKHNMRPMTIDELQDLHYFRNQQTESAFSTFVQLEKRKHISGMYNNREFFMRFVKAPSEIDEKYEDYRYKKVGFAVVKGRVVDDSEAIFTPCKYILEDTRTIEGVQVKDLREIISFRGRFCEQAQKGETIVASGKIEKVIRKDGSEWYQMILGERRDDYFMPIKFFEPKPKPVGVIS